MADPARARKLAVRIRQIVSSAIEMQIKDPRLGMVTITDARVTSDLREATVFYTVYGDETQVADSAAALTSATGVLRSTVGKRTGIKFVDRKSTRLNSSHANISYAVFCLKKKHTNHIHHPTVMTA